ncbi:hypothetical protein MOSE0_J05182 [Monosporozyma servazzii]
MVYSSQSTDRSYRSGNYKYSKHHNRNNNKNKSYNRNNSYYNGPNQTHSRYNVSRYNKDATDNTRPIISPTFQRVKHMPNSNSTSYEMSNYNNNNHNTVLSNDTSTPIQTRYQPHIYSPPAFTSGPNLINNTTISSKGKFNKSRYDPVTKIIPLKTAYNYHSPNKWKKSRFQDSSFNQDYHNSFPPYSNTTKHKRSTRFANPYQNSQSSITHSYIKPQAKIHHIDSHHHTKSDNNIIEPTPRRLSHNSNSVSVEPDTITSIDITNTPLSPTSENEKISSNKDTTILLESKDSEDLEETSDNENEPVEFNSQSQLHDYTHINDPNLLKTNISELIIDEPLEHYPQNSPTYSSYIFPLNKIETKLWHLKHKLRNKLVERPKYIQEHPFTSLSQYSSYPRIINNKQAFQNCFNLLAGFKRIIIKNKLYYRKKYNEDKIIWNKQCVKIKQDDENLKSRVHIPSIEHETKSYLNSTDSFDSGRLNRRDYVNDDELDSIMCEIDPGYKFNKQAAHIPSMIPNPLERNQIQFVNVNNLSTDKNKWALRLLSDKIDTFTEHEHDLFCTGYLRFPKKFDKISHYLGGLRTPEDCVLHYYRTKKTVNYKKLIKERNRRRVKRNIKSAKKMKTANDSKDTSDAAYSSNAESELEEEAVEEEDEEDMEVDGNLDDSSDSDF